MNVDALIKKAIEFSQIKIIKFFFRITEAILVWYYNKTFKKRKKINGKFLSYFKLFCGSDLPALSRRKKHEILYATLDPNSKIDNKVYELTNKSYVKLFNIDPSEVKNTVEYFYKQKIHSSHHPYVDAFSSQLINIEEFLRKHQEDDSDKINSTITSREEMNLRSAV